MNTVSLAPKTQDEVAKWLHPLLGDIVWGVREPGQRLPHFVNTKQAVLHAYDPYRPRYPRKLTQKAIKRHLRGETTAYFTGAWRMKSERLLLMLDIDVKKKNGVGTPEDARRFAEHLNRLPLFEGGVQWEPSTNGLGLHGYVVVERMGYGNPYLRNNVYKHLAKYLEAHRILSGIPVEKVEVKGEPAELTWEKDRLTKVNMGTLAKVPRTDCRSAPTVRAWDVARLQLPKLPKVPKERKSVGSCFFMPGDWAETVEEYRPLAQQVFASANWPTKTQHAVTVEDVQWFLFDLNWASTEGRNEDGSMPWAGSKARWEAAFSAGLTDRQFNGNRFKAIRDGCSRLGLITAKDWSYWYDGKGGGQACKWEGSPLFFGLVEQFVGRKESEEHNNILSVTITGSPLEPLEEWGRPVCRVASSALEREWDPAWDDPAGSAAEANDSGQEERLSGIGSPLAHRVFAGK